jgi:hypothetical protein
MAISNVSSYTSVYESLYASKQTKTSEKTELSADGTSKTNSASQTTEEYLSNLRQKYSNVNITVADFSSDKQMTSYMFSCSGGNNIAISSSIIEKMASDPAVAAKYEKVIADVPKAAEEIRKGVEATGSELLASGTAIDKNGRVSYWCIGKKKEAVENPGTVYKEKVQKQLEEKRAKKKEQEKAEKKKTEETETQEKPQELRLARAESKEELLQKIGRNETEEISKDTAEKLISEGGFKGGRVDYSV